MGTPSEKSPLVDQREIIKPDATTTTKYRIAELISLTIATVVLVVMFIVNGLAASPNAAEVGLGNGTTAVSNEHCVEITPAGWTFSIWGVIYSWQALWIVYGWSFVFRPFFPRSIVFLTYNFYTIANLFNIIWSYLWGNDYAQVGYPIIALFSIALYSTISVQAIWLYRMTPTLMTRKSYKIDLYVTRFLVLNGIFVYATWLTAATELNFAILLQDYIGYTSQTAATAALSVLSVVIVLYFVLENTILDRFLRFVFIVYPVLIWALSGILSAHWETDSDECLLLGKIPVSPSRVNPRFTLGVLILTVVLFAVRIVLWVLFALFRPLFKIGSEKSPLMERLESLKPDTTTTTSYRIAELVSLIIATVALVVVFIVNGLAASPNAAEYGFGNNTAAVSNEHCVEITPAGWTFSIWGVIYTWQALWIVYGWSFVFRPSFPRSIVFLTYNFYTIASIFNIIWTYLWGNDYAQVGYPIIALFSIALYSTVFVQAMWLYEVTPTLLTRKGFKVDLYITRFLVLNGIFVYTTWLTAATELNFAILLQDYLEYSSQIASTVTLSVLTVVIVLYFVLENTILDRFLRFVFIVYPVLIWALSGILSAHWEADTDECLLLGKITESPTAVNRNFTLGVLILTVVLFAVRIVLWVLFAFFRPLFKTGSYEVA